MKGSIGTNDMSLRDALILDLIAAARRFGLVSSN